MTHKKHLSLAILLALAAVLTSCANVVRPTGGPKDKAGPVMHSVDPPSGTRFFNREEVVFYFNEFLKPGNYSKDVFISPVPEVAPEVTVKNKKLRVRFKEPLRRNTTYVVTLGVGIKDFNEGNEMETPVIYAFTTGPDLDSLEIKGKITDSWSNTGEEGMTVILYPAADIDGNNIRNVRPVYASQTDAQGNFSFKYLAPGEYKVYGVKDIDNNYCYSSDGERIALSADPLVVLRDSADQNRFIQMYAFLQDKEAPRLKNMKWANDHTIRVEFNEAVRDSFAGLKLQMVLTDTTGANPKPILTYRKSLNQKVLYLDAPEMRGGDKKLGFTYLMDTLGQYTDTTALLYGDAMAKDDVGKYFAAPKIDLNKSEIRLNAYFRLPEQFKAGQVVIKDTTGKVFDARYRSEGLDLVIMLDSFPSHKIPHEIHIASSLEYPNGEAIDTALVYTFNFPVLDTYGSLSGKIVPDTSQPGMKGVIVFSQGGGKKGTTLFDRLTHQDAYRYKYIPKGKYNVRIIRDADGNGYHSPGSLDPYSLPEISYEQSKPLDVRPKWETKDYDLQLSLPAKKTRTKVPAEGEPAAEEPESESEGEK